MVYRSPWIVQLKRLRPIQSLSTQFHPDTVIIGGGIAGVITAYFTLQQTRDRVLLLEADRVAHGATGHNAGQIVSYFERPLHDIAHEYGNPLTIAAHIDLMKSWDILEDCIRTAYLRTPITQFTGYAGYTTLQQIMNQLRDLHLLSEANIKVEDVLLAKEADLLSKIPSEYHSFCTLVPQTDILDHLETKDSRYIAAYPERKGCTNSGLLVEELIGYLLSTYPERFHLSELTSVKRITLTPTDLRIKTTDSTLVTSTVVLCTNGYTTYQIESLPSPSHLSNPVITPTVGYMNGYLTTDLQPAIATQYFTTETLSPSDPYYYVTRRLYEHGRHAHTLLCVGGPEIQLPRGPPYSRHGHYLPDAHQKLNEFILSTYHHPPSSQKADFQWHGLMGYTPGMIRLVGPDPEYPHLYYNLGCNGVGILPSIYGGKRIACYLAGETVQPSIFTPKARNT
jgi:glycine/D-amino acid oxidase-like deaminating enzyme